MTSETDCDRRHELGAEAVLVQRDQEVREDHRAVANGEPTADREVEHVVPLHVDAEMTQNGDYANVQSPSQRAARYEDHVSLLSWWSATSNDWHVRTGFLV